MRLIFGRNLVHPHTAGHSTIIVVERNGQDSSIDELRSHPLSATAMRKVTSHRHCLRCASCTWSSHSASHGSSHRHMDQAAPRRSPISLFPPLRVASFLLPLRAASDTVQRDPHVDRAASTVPCAPALSSRAVASFSTFCSGTLPPLWPGLPWSWPNELGTQRLGQISTDT